MVSGRPHDAIKAARSLRLVSLIGVWEQSELSGLAKVPAFKRQNLKCTNLFTMKIVIFKREIGSAELSTCSSSQRHQYPKRRQLKCYSYIIEHLPIKDRDREVMSGGSAVFRLDGIH